MEIEHKSGGLKLSSIHQDRKISIGVSEHARCKYCIAASLKPENFHPHVQEPERTTDKGIALYQNLGNRTYGLNLNRGHRDEVICGLFASQ